MRLRCMWGNFVKVEQRKGHLFHTAFDGDGHPALFGKCPEVMRVDNCTAWRPMSSVLKTTPPRVIHPRDIKTWVIHVAGLEWHYVCGVSAREEDGLFTFQKIRRTSFFMYATIMYLGHVCNRQPLCGSMWRVGSKIFESWCERVAGLDLVPLPCLWQRSVSGTSILIALLLLCSNRLTVYVITMIVIYESKCSG